MSYHSNKKQSFAPYAAIIIVAIILIAVANAGAVYYTNIADQDRDHSVISNQQQLISSLANTSSQIDNHYTASVLYHGAQMYLLEDQLNLLNNVSNKLDNLITAHNEMIKAIENATGHHTPIINKITNIHNSYCTVNQVYVPPCHHKK